MTTEQLIQYLIDAGIPEIRANGMVGNGAITDKASADEFLASIKEFLQETKCHLVLDKQKQLH